MWYSSASYERRRHNCFPTFYGNGGHLQGIVAIMGEIREKGRRVVVRFPGLRQTSGPSGVPARGLERRVQTFIWAFNLTIFVLFTLCYAYQMFYVFAVFIKKPRRYLAKKDHRYAAVISGRNESAVIGNLIDSIKAQKYPSDKLDVFVIADNCTDDTAEVSRAHGAYVFERFNQELVGKSWALDYGFKRILDEYADKNYEGFFVFDADNVLDKHFVAEMNNVFDQGNEVVTSYRNSKNFASSWISASYGIWFLREGKFLSQARSVLGNSCAISGTGWLVSTDLIKRDGGWTHHLLTEDIEFSTDLIVHGQKIAYAPNAIVFDEQPITFEASWRQRMRWSRGFYQVLINYGGKLLKTIGSSKSFSAFDMFMTIAPGMLLTLASIVINSICMVIGFVDPNLTMVVTQTTCEALLFTLVNFYAILFGFAVLTVATEWKQIHARTIDKIKYIPMFPIYMLTYAPIAVIAMFKKVEWTPIKHTVAVSVQDILGEASTSGK